MGETVFKIQRDDGKFREGGSAGKFTDTGKTWSQAHHLKNHLMLGRDYYSSAEDVLATHTDVSIVEYELVEIGRYTPEEFWKSK
jgi:hypothetical protein